MTLVELMAVLALIAILAAIAIPNLHRAVADGRVRGAAFYLAGRCGWLRLAAVHRNANVALRFEQAGDTWDYRPYMDGDADGVRSADIAAGRDTPVTDPERIDGRFRGVRFGFAPGCPLIDGSSADGASPVRVGSARMLTFSNAGTSNGGTLYLVGPDTSGYAVVILGATGRTRLLRCYPHSGRWQGDAR
jgi:prepilin-type N-terminal cleavage/methylation domain-containing protein